MGERVMLKEWWEVRRVGGRLSDGGDSLMMTTDVRAYAAAEVRKHPSARRLVHVTRYRGKRPTCDACGAEIGACPKGCDADGHGFCPSDLFDTDDHGHVSLCHGCAWWPTPTLDDLWMVVQRRRQDDHPARADGAAADGEGR